MDATATPAPAPAPAPRTLVPAPIPEQRTTLLGGPLAAAPQREKTRPIACWSTPELVAAVAGKQLGTTVDLPIWARGGKNLSELAKDELALVLGVTAQQAKRIQAAFEIHRRLGQADAPVASLRNPEELAAYMQPYVGHDHERLWVVPVDAHQRPLLYEPRQVSQGTTDGTDCDPRSILRSVITLGANGFFIVHNHPSEDVTPSTADRAVTRAIAQAGRAVGTPLRDHLVMNRHGAFSSLRRLEPALFAE